MKLVNFSIQSSRGKLVSNQCHYKYLSLKLKKQTNKQTHKQTTKQTNTSLLPNFKTDYVLVIFFGSHCCYYVFKLSLNYVTIKSLIVYKCRIHCFVYRPTSKRNQHTRFRGSSAAPKPKLSMFCALSQNHQPCVCLPVCFLRGSHQNMFDVRSGGIEGHRPSEPLPPPPLAPP